MVVKTLLTILEKYQLCEDGVIVQFVTHKNGSFWADEIYEDAILVTPIDIHGKPNHFASRYIRSRHFKNWEMRGAFMELAKDHNVKTQHKRFGIPIFIKENYCTIQ